MTWGFGSGGGLRERLAGVAAGARPLVYDAAAAAVFLPLGGVRPMREGTVELLGVRPGARVLELGCGTGALTASLVRRGAVVTAVDRSVGALRRAQRRVARAAGPGGAEFVRADLVTYVPDRAAYDVVLLAFVLHELPPATRHEVLRAAALALAPHGTLGVLDWARPDRGWTRAWVVGFVAAGEPAWARGWIARPVDDHLRAAGLTTMAMRRFAYGAAQFVRAAPGLTD